MPAESEGARYGLHGGDFVAAVEALGVACPNLVKLNLSHAAIATVDPTITATPAAAAATADDRGAEEDGCCDECGDTFEGDAASSPPGLR